MTAPACAQEQERPKDALDYIKSTLGAPTCTPEQYDALVAEKERLASELETARAEIDELKAKLAGEAAS